MQSYTDLIKALRSASTVSTAFGKLMADAADAIEALQAQLPKRGKWHTELFDGDKKYQCLNCLTHWDVETRYCPFCGAKMEVQDAD